MDFSFEATGFMVGMVVGLTGVGGGALMTPLLIFIFGVAPKTAVGTDLFFAALTKVFGVLVHEEVRCFCLAAVGWARLSLIRLCEFPGPAL